MFQRLLCIGSLIVLGLASCSSVRHEKLEPLTVLRQQELLRVVEPGSAKFEARWTPPELQSQGRRVRLGLQMFGVDPECLRQALGEGPELLGAVVVPREQATRLCEALKRRGEREVHGLSDSTLEVFAGDEACVSVGNERAFVGAFEISTTAAGAIADPRIDVAQEGILFHVEVEPLQGTEEIGFRFELTQSFLDHPFLRRNVGLQAGRVPVTLEIPIGLRDQLNARIRLRGDEAIVFACDRLVNDGNGRSMLAVLTADLVAD